MSGVTRRLSGWKIVAAGAVLGAALGMLMPESWSNLAESPPGLAWWILPAFLAYAAACLLVGLDFVSNAGSNPWVLQALWIGCLALIAGLYGLVIAGIVHALQAGWRWALDHRASDI